MEECVVNSAVEFLLSKQDNENQPIFSISFHHENLIRCTFATIRKVFTIV